MLQYIWIMPLVVGWAFAGIMLVLNRRLMRAWRDSSAKWQKLCEDLQRQNVQEVELLEVLTEAYKARTPTRDTLYN